VPDPGYNTFEECCEKEAETDKSRVTRLIAAADIAEFLMPMGTKIPARERHARPLTALPPTRLLSQTSLSSKAS
jgi:hypothetical protein